MDQIKGLWKGLKAKSEEAVQAKPKWKGQGRVLGGAPPVRARNIGHTGGRMRETRVLA